MTDDGRVDHYTMLIVLVLLVSSESAVAGALFFTLVGTLACAFVISMLFAVYTDVMNSG